MRRRRDRGDAKPERPLAPRPAGMPGASASAASRGDGPVRRCIVSGEILAVAEMVRFVVGPDGAVVPDVGGRLPGRGLWLRSQRVMVETACVKRLFARAARRPVRVPEGLADGVERLLARRCLDLVGLARRAGELAAGFEAARQWLLAGRAGLVVTAADGSAGAGARLRVLAGARMPVVDVLSGAELGTALGWNVAAFLVLAPGPLAERLAREAARLAGFRRPAAMGRPLDETRRSE